MHTRTATLLFLLAPLAIAACSGVEDREGGLFSPFPDDVSGAAGGAESSGGGMELPPASDFVPEEPTAAPLVVDTGEPPAVVAGDDDDSAAVDEVDALADEAVEAPVEPPTPPAVVEPITAAPVIQTPVYAEVTPEPPVQVPVQTTPPQTAPAIAAAAAGTCEAALTMSAPLSDIALIATIPDATPARAIVRFPSGEERVVQVGDLLGDSGAKVLMITAGSVKLAEIAVSEPDRPSIVTHYLHQSR